MLLDAAARLFAERGVDNVSIAEIVREARQRNASAVQYHIGNRDDVLFAVLARHVPAIAERRHQLLERARSTPAMDIRPAGWRERAYLQIGSELSGAIDRTSTEIQELMTKTDGYAAWDLLRERCPEVPADLWRVRREICIVFVGRAAADRARLLDNGDAHGVLSDDRFVGNLIDMVIGAMTAPSGGG